MKLGIAAAHTPDWPKVQWVCEAATRIGHDVRRATTANELPDLFRECDLVILGHKSLAGRWPNVREAIKNRQCPVVYWFFDLVAATPGVPLVEQQMFQTFRPFFENVDLSLVKERNLLGEYRQAGCRVEWFDQGCPSTMPAVVPVKPEWDLLVWGQYGHYRQRAHAVESAIRAGFTVAWAGTGPYPNGVVGLPWTPPESLPALASRARCVLSCGVRNDLDSYYSDALWLALGMGACVIRKATRGLPNGPYFMYHDDHEVVDRLRWARSHPEEAVETGRRAREWVMGRHTLEHRVRELLTLVAGTVMAPGMSPAS